jgi:hypothetical protein
MECAIEPRKDESVSLTEKFFSVATGGGMIPEIRARRMFRWTSRLPMRMQGADE